MKKLILLLCAATVMIAVRADFLPGKLSSPSGKPLQTEGKTYRPKSPGHNLMFGGAGQGFSAEKTDFAANSQTLRAPSRIPGESGTDLQGFLKASSSPDYPAGWYDININGQVEHLFSNSAMLGSCGFVRQGKICQFTSIQSYGYYWFYYSEYSLENGDELFEVELTDTDMRNYVVNCVYDENEDMVYMQTYSKNFTQLAWSAFNPETRERTYLNNGLSWDDNRVVAIGINPRDSRIHGIKSTGEYVSIDRLSGEATKVCDLSVSPAEFSQSMVYAPFERGFVWAAMLADNTSGFYRIEPSTGEVSLLGQMPVQNQFLMLWCDDKDAPDAAPDMPTVGWSFDRASLTGTATVTFPEKSFGGQPLSSTAYLEAQISLEGTPDIKAYGQPGQSVNISVTLPQGMHLGTAKCRVKDSGQWGPAKPVEVYVGFDMPKAPANVCIADGVISWDAPTASQHGGYVDFSKIRYRVMLNDLEVTSEPVEATSVAYTPPAALAIWYPKVYAIADGMTSEPGTGPGIRHGEFLEFPFSFTPTEQEFGLMSVVDGNNDRNSWKYFNGKDCVYYNTGSSNQAADEWLIFPPADFSDTSHLYRLAFDAKALLMSRPEDFEVCLLTSANPAEAEKILLADYPLYNKDQWTRESIKFSIPAENEYHLAFHCTTPDGFQLMLQNFRCEKTADTMKSPAECKGIKVTGAENGLLQGVATFTAPTKALDGTPLETSKEITVYARTSAGEGSVKVKPGGKGEVSFPCTQGMNQVIIVPANEYGEGFEKKYEVFAGQEKPGKVQNLISSVSADNLSMTIRWDAPTEGESGGYINPDEVGYFIFGVSDGELYPLEDIGTRREYTLTVSPGQQSLQQLAVGPYNIAGSSASDTFRGTSAILGTPLTVPFTETFGYGIPRYLPNVITRPNSVYTAQWGHGDPTAIVYDAVTPDWGCMYAQPTVAGVSLGRVEIPRVSTKGYKNICFYLRAFRFPQGGVVRILGRPWDSKEFVEVMELDLSKGTKGYTEDYYKLPASLQNQPWIALAIEAEFDNHNTQTYVIIDDYALVDLPDNDMAVVQVTGDDRTQYGATGGYTVTVANLGKETQAYNLHWSALDSEDREIASGEIVGSPLEPAEQESSNFQVGALTLEDSMRIRCTVSCEADDSEINDTKEIPVAVLGSGTGRISDLRGEITAEGFRLEWSRPEMRNPQNEDFSVLTMGEHGEDLGNWRNLDRDGKDVCGISGITIPDGGAPKAWQALDGSVHEYFTPRKGGNLLLAMTPADESAANDWLISPEVAPGTEVVFAANTITTGFTEEFEVLASATDNDPSSFVRVAAFTKAIPGWETFMVRLPRDARYFAIRYCSVDQFGMMLDDISYVPADAPARQIGSYAVYRDGSKRGEVATETYTDPEATNGMCYMVAPVVEGSETGCSNAVTYDTTGISPLRASAAVAGGKGHIWVRGLAGAILRVSSSDGASFGSLAITSPVQKVSLPVGVYMVEVQGAIYKVMVR